MGRNQLPRGFQTFSALVLLLGAVAGVGGHQQRYRGFQAFERAQHDWRFRPITMYLRHLKLVIDNFNVSRFRPMRAGREHEVFSELLVQW